MIMNTLMDKDTVIEENVRSLRGLSFLLSKLASSDDLDKNEEHMYGFLSDSIEIIANQLEAAMELEK